MHISLSPFAPEDLVSRDGFGSPVPRQPAHLHTPAEPGLTGFLPSSAAASICLFKLPYAIGLGFLLPRVRRHRASKPQGSSKRVLPWQVTMDKLICAHISHTHYWYEVGMLKVSAHNKAPPWRQVEQWSYK